ncbi:hypothetical protein EVAR_53232_1 [Eumeta japonica]|uniref:Uncharacterized protein n=1 Tax=Eumeta variegata TaxID=151549 RepID=A0A4C1XGI7_EUMVA|nr:hypothetical protein EVAR_53232_1 [Eumeta japonica]
MVTPVAYLGNHGKNVADPDDRFDGDRGRINLRLFSLIQIKPFATSFGEDVKTSAADVVSNPQTTPHQHGGLKVKSLDKK